MMGEISEIKLSFSLFQVAKMFRLLVVNNKDFVVKFPQVF